MTTYRRHLNVFGSSTNIRSCCTYIFRRTHLNDNFYDLALVQLQHSAMMSLCNKDHDIKSCNSDTPSSEGKHLIYILHFHNAYNVNGLALFCVHGFCHQYSAYLRLSAQIFVVPNVAIFLYFSSSSELFHSSTDMLVLLW